MVKPIVASKRIQTQLILILSNNLSKVWFTQMAYLCFIYIKEQNKVLKYSG